MSDDELIPLRGVNAYAFFPRLFWLEYFTQELDLRRSPRHAGGTPGGLSPRPATSIPSIVDSHKCTDCSLNAICMPNDVNAICALEERKGQDGRRQRGEFLIR